MTNPITCNTFCASSNDVNLGSSSISFSEIKTEITGGKDSKSKGKSVKRTKNDVSGGIDNKLRGKSINRSKTDLLGEVDNKLKLKSLNRMRTDVFAGVDSKLREKSILRQMNDILGGVDSKTKIASLKRILSELITAVDTESRIKDVYRAFYDCLDNLDGTERFKEIYRELTDFFDAVDNQSKVKDIFRGFIDYIEGYDTKSQEFGFNRLFSEVIELLDIETRTKTLERTITDKLDELDSKLRTKTINRISTDILGILDTFKKEWNRTRIFTDLLGSIDMKSFSRGFLKTFIDKIGGKDSKTRTKTIKRIKKEKLGNVDWWYDPDYSVQGMWHLNETSGTIAHDSSVNKNHLHTINQIVPASGGWIEAKLNNGLKVVDRGSSSAIYLIASNSYLCNFEKDDLFTIEMWHNNLERWDRVPYDNPHYKGIMRDLFVKRAFDIDRETTGYNFSYWGIYPDPKTIDFNMICSGGRGHFHWNVDLTAYTWYHIVFVFNGPLLKDNWKNWMNPGEAIKLYINGVSLPLAYYDYYVPWDSLGSLKNSGVFTLDKPASTLLSNTSSVMDEVVVYGRLLTPEEILDRYNNGEGKELGFQSQTWMLYMAGKDTLHRFINHGKYGFSDITEMKDTVTRIIKYSLHHGHQHWWRDKPKQKVVVGD